LQRVDPIGYDAQQNIYWLFDGIFYRLLLLTISIDNRLYMEKAPAKESPKKRGKKDAEASPISRESTNGEKPWRLVCSTVEDWQAFPLQFEGSRNPQEKALLKVLQDGILSDIVDVLKEKRKEKEREAIQMYRKRSTRLLGLDMDQSAILDDNVGRRSLRATREGKVC
jgi:hypothetical protein